MRWLPRSVLPLILAGSLGGCSQPLVDDDLVSAEAAQTAEARLELTRLEGEWVVEERTLELSPVPERVRVSIGDRSVDPTTGATQGTFLRIMRVDVPTVPAVDRAPFLDVDEGRKCENVAFAGASSATICHTTTLAGNVLTHTVSVTEWTGWILPTGWSKATQTLTLDPSRAKLRYTYDIDGELSHDVTFRR